MQPVLGILLAGLLFVQGALPRHPTPLDTYVHTPDPVYSYRPVSVIEGQGYTAHVLEVTSQTWRKPDEVDRTIWKHWLTVYVPHSVEHRTALLYIGGGRNTDQTPAEVDPDLSRISTSTHSVTVHLRQVPNEPLIFTGEKTPRREDGIIAYTWERFLRTGDPTWVPRLPMTKSAVRAMDAVVDFCARPEIGSLRIESFVVAGSSKRGWTAWTTAAVDPRVVAIVPMVIDLLNVEPSFRHHFRSYGSWSPAIQEFIDLGIPNWFGTPEFRALERIEDPYSYRKRLKLPKLIVNATGDPFFMPDSSRFYFADLPGEKHLRYVPNADHSLNGTDAFASLQAFYQEILARVPRPEYSWRFKGPASIRLRTESARPPLEVRLWQVVNPDARDFRLATIGKSWKGSRIERRAHGVYVASIVKPARGWAAFFLELTYRGTGTEPLKFTTAVRVVPDTMPYAWRGREH